MATNKELDYYKKLLQIIGSLSNLFSESKVPYLNYRVVENLYCKAFNAKNLSRSDVSADASLHGVGIGIKTFVHGNGKSLQKVAEFNKDNIQFRQLRHDELINKVADLRNQRIEATKRIYGFKNMMYHCIVRDEGKISAFECGMHAIDKKSIQIMSSTKNTISFKDALHQYSFNITKSTLYKRFLTKEVLFEIDVNTLKDPFAVLEEKFSALKAVYYKKTIQENPFVILPLYSTTRGEKIVYTKSGLNQWNARGRKRDANEIYIPIPAWIHKRFPDFFLSRDTPFTLILPDGTRLEAKVCQDGSKALMSKQNSDLGNWLLRQVLNVKEKEVLTYEKLQAIGLDSVILQRLDNKTYSIDFKSSGTYEAFVKEHK